ncbi:ABC transporter permease [Sediminispirochaeta smaragdinae]|uniref:Inner-membrane translocator n=1 Tax=Sediminispirochaeta smaragdinae (strain DSM 11293 / JCM 15392 / SEBR 4228) TaxID=573413 RepID=E1R8L9_SEDSS|nr:ABC transporter permease [Sediminispirochaeta smaragdinae]ADK81776.1 inner-membrane translocator [Sediminispirochaeta smaragdinae DSM 11293]
MKEKLRELLQWSRLRTVVIPVIGVLIGMLVGSLVIVNKDRSLFTVMGQLFYGAFGNLNNFSQSLVFAIPLGFTGLAIALSYSAGIFNIGAEGQLQLAALATAVVATSGFLESSPLLLPVVLICGMIMGALWALLPGILKAYKGFNEIVVTMLLNYVAILLVSFFLQGPLKAEGAYYPQTDAFPDTALLHKVIRGYTLHQGIWVFILMVVIVWVILYKTTFGFKIRAVGFNPEGALYAGIDYRKILVLSMLVSGALAGLAGSVEVLGVHRRLMEGFSPGYGYDAIAVALLANLNPVGIIFSSFFFGALRNAASGLQIDFGIPVSFIYIIQALAIIFVIAAQGMPRFFRRLKRRLQNV